MNNEEYHEALLPLQQETIARAALAGVRWERIEVTDWEWRGRGRMHKNKRTKFIGLLADGTSFGEFEDIYECALVGLSVVDTSEQPARPDIDGFELREDNAQPAPTGRRASGIDFAALRAKRGLP